MSGNTVRIWEGGTGGNTKLLEIGKTSHQLYQYIQNMKLVCQFDTPLKLWCMVYTLKGVHHTIHHTI